MSMAGALEAGGRLSLFLRSQAPVLVSVVLVVGLVLAAGVDVRRPGWLLAGAIALAVVTAASLALPWERLPLSAQAPLALGDLLAVAALSLAFAPAVPGIVAIAGFPAVWASIVLPRWGAVCGVGGTVLAGVAPLLFDASGPQEWAAGLVIPVVVAVLAVGGLLLVAEVQRATAAEADATAEAERQAVVMRSFADEIDIGLMYLDARGGDPESNETIDRFRRLAGGGADGSGGTHVYEGDRVTPVAPEDQVVPRLRRGESIAGEVHWVGPAGRQRALLSSGRGIHGADGEQVGMMLVVQDITDVVVAERSREDALATLAHELRTPLTSIVGYAELLAGADLPTTAAAHLSTITRNADQLLTLTSVFLDGLHRPSHVERRPTSLRELVDECIDALLPTPGFAEREVVVAVDAHLSAPVDRDAMGGIIANLLHNAVKFSRSGDRVTVAGGARDADVWIGVHNTGSRIDPTDRERVFDRFYRGRNAHRDAVPGTGIGLAVSRDIVLAHGGTIGVVETDAGTEVRVTLPAQ
ncbi:sensor histidine kinase [Microbacterium sp. NPDC091313]